MARIVWRASISEALPLVKEDGKRVKILLGEYNGQRSPISDPHTRVQYLDVALSENQEFRHRLDSDLVGFIYVFEGSATIGNTELPQHTFAVLDDGDTLDINSGQYGARFIMVAGRPIDEPIVQYGPFVMNTQKEIDQALRDYQSGQLVRDKAMFVSA